MLYRRLGLFEISFSHSRWVWLRCAKKKVFQRQFVSGFFALETYGPCPATHWWHTQASGAPSERTKSPNSSPDRRDTPWKRNCFKLLTSILHIKITRTNWPYRYTFGKEEIECEKDRSSSGCWFNIHILSATRVRKLIINTPPPTTFNRTLEVVEFAGKGLRIVITYQRFSSSWNPDMRKCWTARRRWSCFSSLKYFT